LGNRANPAGSRTGWSGLSARPCWRFSKYMRTDEAMVLVAQ
jgi:hypothetical protein